MKSQMNADTLSQIRINRVYLRSLILNYFRHFQEVAEYHIHGAQVISVGFPAFIVLDPEHEGLQFLG